MALDLANYLTRVKSLLQTGTYDALTYSDALITEGVRQALREYDQSCPPTSQVLTVTDAGRDQSITGLTTFQELLLVAWPYTADVDWRPYVVNWHVLSPGKVELETAGIPAVGDKILCYYRLAHAVKDLDSAAASTVEAQHESLMVLGAAGWSAELHYRQVAEAVKGPTAEQIKRMYTWGYLRLQEFRRGLVEISKGGPAARPCWGDIGL